MLTVALTAAAAGRTWAQTTPGKQPAAKPATPITAPITAPGKSSIAPADSGRTAGLKPAAAGDTLVVPLGRGRGKRDIESTIVYSARDSIRLDAPGKVAYLFGDAKITYGTTHLEAELVKIEYGQNLVTAEGAPDSTGKLVGTPIFTDKGEQYEAKKIAYNFKSKKGKISEAITKQGEGYIHAEAVKRQGEKELYGLHGEYTTCDLPHPHFYIAASKMKVVPGEKIVTGPFNLVVADIPLPLGFLFGYFPTPQTRSSGIIIPSYGESPTRGFSLLNGGYYWAASPHVGVRLTGDFYTLGGWAARADVQYKTRYKFDGGFLLSFARQKIGERSGAATDLNRPGVLRDGDLVNVQWNHRPVARPGHGQFSASVNAGSSFFYRSNVNTTTQNRLATSFNSGVQYQKSLPGSPFNYTISARQAQALNPVTGVTSMDFDLPNLSFGVAQQTPLRWLALRTGRTVFNNLTASYTLSATNRFRTTRSPGVSAIGLTRVVGQPTTTQNLNLGRDGVGAILRNGAPAVQHGINIGLGTYTLAHVNLSPSVSYGEAWTFEKFSYQYDPDSMGVRVNRQRGLYRVYRYNYGLSATTRLYGLLRLPKKARVEAVRAVFNPEVGYSYTPDFGDPSFGYYKTGVRTNESSSYQTLPRFAGVPGRGRSSSLSLRLSSNVEAKLRPAAGDTATKSRKLSLIDQFSVATRYNFAADSLQLAPVVASLNTRLFNLFGINLGAQFDPYQRDTSGRPLDRYLFDAPGRKLARLASANASVSFAFNPASRQRAPTSNQQAAQANVPGLPGTPTDPTGAVAGTVLPNGGLGGVADYEAFDLPWTLTAGFGLNYAAPSPRGQLPNVPLLSTSTLRLSGSVQLTQKWALTYDTSLDTRTGQLVAPNINIVRDLHCWLLSANWFPVGDLQSYVINLNVKSTILQDLKLTRNRSYQNR